MGKYFQVVQYVRGFVWSCFDIQSHGQFCLCQITVPPENIYPFTEVLPRPIRRLTPHSRLSKDVACQNFTDVLPRFAAACNIAVNGKTR